MRRIVSLLPSSLLVCVLAAGSSFAEPHFIPIRNSSIAAAASSNPFNFVRVGSKVFFQATDATHGTELWITDGTSAGTALVKDINPNGGTSQYVVGAIGSFAISVVTDTSSARSIWRSDGTAAGTVRFASLPAPVDPYSGQYALLGFPADTQAFFLIQQTYSGPRELYVTDGTAAGTRDVASTSQTGPTPIGVNGFLYFVSQDSTVGAQLWISDGTKVGTHMVRRNVECAGAACGPTPTFFFRIGANVAFLTADSVWVTDGTGQGTRKLAAVKQPQGVVWSASSPLAYFRDGDGMLWKTDGTAAGTTAITATPSASGLVLDDERLVFFVNAGNRSEFWKSDGTAAGTVRVASASISAPSPLAAVGHAVLLSATSSDTGSELWSADPDAGTLALVKDIDSRISSVRPFSSSPGVGAVLGSQFIFPATDAYGRELWRSDGTGTGTKLLANIAADPGGGVISGTVRAAADGSPATEATVFLCPPAGGSCDIAGADAKGFYHFDGVLPGSYTVGARSAYFVTQLFDGVNCPCTAGSGSQVPVTAGVETAGIDFSLIAGGWISGTVTRAKSGSPIAAAEVQIVDSKGSLLDDVGTDAQGHWRTYAGLTTGTYYAIAFDDYDASGIPAVAQIYNGHDCPSPCATAAAVGNPISVTTGAETSGIDFALHGYGTISGTVRDDNGGAVSRINVSFLRQGQTSPSASAITDSGGQYTSPLLVPGPYYVLAGSGSGFALTVYPSGACAGTSGCTPTGNATTVSVPNDGTTTGIDIQLGVVSGQSRIAGTIRDRNGKPFAGITVMLLDTHGLYISAYGGPSTTGTDGRYIFYGLPAGTYYVRALDELYPGGTDCFSQPCNVAAGTSLTTTAGHTTAAADMTLRSAPVSITGRVLDAVTSQPITNDQSLSAYAVSTTTGISLGSAAFSGATYTISGISRETSFYVRATASGHHGGGYNHVRWDCTASSCSAPAGLTAVPSGAANVDVLLDRLGSISGIVVDKNGKPVSAQVILFNALTSATGGNAFTDATGHYVTYPAAGTYAVYTAPFGVTGAYNAQIYRDHDCAGECFPPNGDPVTATDGTPTTGIDFHLTIRYGTLSGHVTDAETGLPMQNVYVQVVDNPSFSARTDAQGLYSIAVSQYYGSLPDGKYRLYAELDAPYYLGLSGGGTCGDFYTCNGNGTPVQLTAPNTTVVDFRMVRMRITSVSPAVGPASGGTQIVVSGQNLPANPTVMIGQSAATIVSASPTQIIAKTPAGTPGPAHVTVRASSNLADTLTQAFSYLAPKRFPPRLIRRLRAVCKITPSGNKRPAGH